MLRKPNKSIVQCGISILAFFCICCTSKGQSPLVLLQELPNELSEISGISMLSDQLLYAINDSGNKNALFRLTPQGAIVEVFTLSDTKNVDWEDLASDPEGNLYIGDFGNNKNDRKDLTIYKVSDIVTNVPKTTAITFSLEDQKKFPPKRRHANFDIEAFIYLDHSFYLFTKDRSKPYSGITKVYAVPAQEGHHSARHIASFSICAQKSGCSISGATISPIKDQVVLLTPNQLVILDHFNPNAMHTTTVKTIPLHHYSQKEGLCFKNDSTLLITEEGRGHRNGYIYEYKWKP